MSLNCVTEGASIGYQLDDKIGSERWLLYHEPLKFKRGQKMVVRANRIGYKVSEEQFLKYMNMR
jgi:N-sulfoglucosamine sulfohydrolase